MATPFARLGASRRLILSFVLVLLVPAVAVVWLGARLIEQDRALASRQLRERRESAADRLIAGLEQAVSATERRLDGDPSALSIAPDDDAVVVTLRPDGIESYPRNLLYLPVLQSGPPEPGDAFEAAEALEFRAQDHEGAAALYRALATSRVAGVRAGALLRLARTLRKSGGAGDPGAFDDALSVYAELALIRDVRLTGLPADLVARRARCDLLEELGRGDELEREARELSTDLRAGHWQVDEGTFLAYTEEVGRWVGAEPGPARNNAHSDATAWVWRQWTESSRVTLPPAGRRALQFAGVGVTLLWHTSDDRWWSSWQDHGSSSGSGSMARSRPWTRVGSWWRWLTSTAKASSARCRPTSRPPNRAPLASHDCRGMSL